MTEQFYQTEDRDGVRCTFHTWPNSKQSYQKNILPLSILYTFHKDIQGLGLVEYEPVPCQKCKSILNNHCPIDFITKVWACPFCLNRNAFPAHYKAHITESTLPTELTPSYSTIEYILSSVEEVPPIFFFIIDTSCDINELALLKSSLQQCINLIPAEALVGLITYGKHAYLYNLSWAECTRCVAFKGDKVLEGKAFRDYLSFGSDPKSLQLGVKKYIVPVTECEFIFTSIIDELAKDPWTVPAGNRPFRCTGTALTVCLNLLELAYSKKPARILLFTSGACTFGPGLIVSENLLDVIRTFQDIKEDTALYSKQAVQFYDNIAHRASQSGYSIDVFCTAIDQIGLFEMKNLGNKTGGCIILTDTYKSEVFSTSLQKVFNRDETGGLVMGFDAQVKVWTSPGVGISGAIGPGYSAMQKTQNVSEVEIGCGQTNTWKINSFDNQTTAAYYLDITTSEPAVNKGHAVVQFQVNYIHSSGRTRLRVTTVRFPYNEQNELGKTLTNFDQETATVALARWSVFKTEKEETIEVVRWLDRLLIKFMKKFADYRFEVRSSFRLHPNISLFPQFIFHLRRSQFLQSFNLSPDESSYYRQYLFRETITNSLLMIQPALLQYSFDSQDPKPVLLDIDSLKNEVILLLDTFFTVVVWHGEVIAKWVKLKYHEQDDYAHLKLLLSLPLEDAKSIVQQRFPTPKLVVTDSGKGQERLLKAKVNPSKAASSQTGNYLSEDVSLKLFMDSLIDFVVRS